MDQTKVFLDSDVLISALLSSSGASFEILRNKRIKKVISKTVKEEVIEVTKRLNIDFSAELTFKDIDIISLKLNKGQLLEKYTPFVSDAEDSHVVAGCHKAKTRFLLTHNLKHYHLSKIKNDFDIIVMKPGNFLQYLRSQDKLS